MSEIEWFDQGEYYISCCGMITIGKDGSWVKSHKALDYDEIEQISDKMKELRGK